jgi:Lectin C-type domain
MKLTLLTFITAALSIGSSSGEWVEWTTAAGGNGHFYEAVLVTDGIDWLSAKTQAEARGGYLATITSAAENTFVHSLIATDSRFWWNWDDTRGPWLGGYQISGSEEPGGGWAWVTGEPFVYQNWAAYSPNNYGPEDYLHYFGTGPDNFADTWNDLNMDGGPHGFIVECVPEPGTGALCGLFITGFVLRRRSRR